MKNKHFLYVLFAFFFFFSILPSTTAAHKMPNGTKIGSFMVENQTEKEIRSLLDEELALWYAKDDFVLQGDFETITISRDVFRFDVDETISQLKEETKRKLSTLFRRPKNTYVPLIVSVDESHTDLQYLKGKSYIDYEKQVQRLTEIASELEDGPISIVYEEGEEPPLDKIAEVKLKFPDLSKATIDYLVEELDGFVFQPKEIFSFLDSLDAPEKLLNSRDETSFLATGLYHLFLQGNFEIIERNPQLTLPNYGKKGINAEVNQRDGKDLIVKNIGEHAYRLGLKKGEEQLTFILEGKDVRESYRVKVDKERKISPRTIYRYSKSLKPGEEKLLQAGKAGLALDVIRSVYEDDVFIKDETISKDLYLPTPEILLVSADSLSEDNTSDTDTSTDGAVVEDVDEIQLSDLGEEIVSSLPIDASVVDYLPEDFKKYEIVQEIKELDKMLTRYDDFLTFIEKEYKESIEKGDQRIQEVMKIYKEAMGKLEKAINKFLDDLLEQEIIDEDVIEKWKEVKESADIKEAVR